MNRVFLSLSLVLLLAAGCRSTAPQSMTPLTVSQAKHFLAKARDPRLFGITTYPSDDGDIFVNANLVASGQHAILPLRSDDPSWPPIVRIRLGDASPTLALIDTSSMNNWVVLSAARQAGAIPLTQDLDDRKLASHVVETIGGYLVTTEPIEMGGARVTAPLFYARAAQGAMGPLARRLEKPVPSAVLGCSLLRSFRYVQFDFPEKRVVLSSISEYFPDPSLLLARLPLESAGGVLGARAILDQKEALVILDTGGDFELAMTEPPTAPFRQVALGDLILRQVNVTSARDLGLGLPKYPRLGRKLLSRYKVTFDWSRKLIYFERPAQP